MDRPSWGLHRTAALNPDGILFKLASMKLIQSNRLGRHMGFAAMFVGTLACSIPVTAQTESAKPGYGRAIDRPAFGRIRESRHYDS